MQIFYDNNNIKKNFLNCYVKIFREQNNIYFVNTLFNTELELTSEPKNIEILLQKLYKGVSTKELLLVLKKFSSLNEELYVYMLQQGIIE